MLTNDERFVYLNAKLSLLEQVGSHIKDGATINQLKLYLGREGQRLYEELAALSRAQELAKAEKENTNTRGKH